MCLNKIDNGMIRPRELMLCVLHVCFGSVRELRLRLSMTGNDELLITL